MIDNQWVRWAMELQDLSQCALAYCRDRYDIERFKRIREISAEMMTEMTGLPGDEIRELFCSGTGYQTPKIDTRSAVFRDGKILLAQERNGLWALPGGWVDYNLSVGENAVKEVFEETGVRVRAVRVIALQDHNRRHAKPSLHEICSVFMLCEYLSGAFIPNIETIASDWFAPDCLPPLCEEKTTAAQIALCFQAAADPNWVTRFD